MSQTDTRAFKLVVAYNGARFKGWQRGNGRTVQGTLEEALRTALNIDTEVIITGSGRTDAGVHAEGQVAGAWLPKTVDPDRLLADVNAILPSDVVVQSLLIAENHRFHARYHAIGRS